MFTKVLIANRGAIACRIIRTLRRMGVASVAVYSDADAGSLHVSMADEAVRIGPAPASESYLDAAAILAAARATGAQAIHPGYGFLSENTAFAAACDAAGVVFIGPSTSDIEAFGLKHTARELARQAKVPLAPGSGLLSDAAAAVEAADAIGYPVMLKATAGGGGIGMRVCADAAQVREAFASVERLAQGAFGDSGVFVERFVPLARHIEVQVFGDGTGRVVALGERDCSLQRRNQKVVEETPAPGLPEATRTALCEAAIRLCSNVRYRSAGTVEFLYDAARDDFFFLEVNTRLQVEHGVTEQVHGVDLVEWMIRAAAGDVSFLDGFRATPQGASIQVRLYAEDPAQDYRPSSGVLAEAAFPPGVRVETWVGSGSEISAHYDPMIAKLIVTAPDRTQAVTAMQAALDQTRLAGLETNLDWLRQVVRSQPFVTGEVSTAALGAFAYTPRAMRIVSGGAGTTIQDYPGRQGYWNIGVPPSGPMDDFSFRLANRLVGNTPDAAALEVTALGPVIEFLAPALVCLAGAPFAADLDGVHVELFRPFEVEAGQVLRIGRAAQAGMRAYLAVRGGLDASVYLGSRSTFTLGGFGGLAGRNLAAGDLVRIGQAEVAPPAPGLDPALCPEIGRNWTLRVLAGPHGAPDFFTPEDVAMIAAEGWKVHYNSSRTGVRLMGPKPKWARRDGGEAGLHPSNIHDNPYAIGAVDFTGDMPIILGPDGPSLGGFVCPFVVIGADLWKVGQLAAGDTVRFEPVSSEAALVAASSQALFIETLAAPARPVASAASPPRMAEQGGVINVAAQDLRRPQRVYRRQGERNLLVEYGPLELDIELRARVHALMLALQERRPPGVIDITPGIRSLQVHYDPAVLSESRLIDLLDRIDESLGALDDFEAPSRIVHLPLSWRDPAITQTIERYMASVRDDAPWCPDNIEFIRRINGLESEEEVRRIIFGASYLVMGLGDVYLGAPVAVPVDPRHRLVTTKYNPARTWTPPNVVGIGGAYMCVYGMEGPGGYQLFGRTLQVWSSWRRTGAFAEAPWLLRFFDQIRFFPVSAEELASWRADFPLGRRPIQIEETRFRLSDYRALLASQAEEISAFQARRQAAFEAERIRWRESGEFDRLAELSAEAPSEDVSPASAPEGSELVEAPLGGSVWKINVSPGQRVERGDVIAVVEAMKTECDVTSPFSGTVTAVFAREREPISAGAAILAIEAA